MGSVSNDKPSTSRIAENIEHGDPVDQDESSVTTNGVEGRQSEDEMVADVSTETKVENDEKTRKTCDSLVLENETPGGSSVQPVTEGVESTSGRTFSVLGSEISGDKNTDAVESESEASLTTLIRRISNFLLSKIPEDSQAGNLERPRRKRPRKRVKHPVIITYPQSQRPRQPFMNQPTNRRPPNPPSYYTNAVTQEQHQPQFLRGDYQETRERRPVPMNQGRTTRDEIVLTPNMNYQPGQVMMMPNAFMNFAYWAPYPENIPSNIPPCLAHLYAAESLFIVQQMDLIELFNNISEPNYYLIQDTSGQCLYYAYETTNLLFTEICNLNRGFQLHIMDMYHNEIIYMNKPCGCNGCFCCYPVLEVYSPPLVPVGAISQKFSACYSEFIILDADENKAFTIRGPCCCVTQCHCGEVDFTIHALDEDATEVGIIRRQAGNIVTSLYSNTDYYGISFPVDLDVRLKAVFLGALFLIEYSYYDTRAN